MALHSRAHPVDVWLIEDNESYRRSVERVLGDAGALNCSHSFASCEDALSTLENESPPTVILLDIGLPGMSGIEGTQRIKALSPTTEIVILTVYDDDDKLFHAICAGASGYLLKNSPKETILEAISVVLAGGAPMNPTIARRTMAMFRQFGASSNPEKYNLTKREREVLQLLVDGGTMKEIAEKIFISPHTVNTHLKNIYSKLQVNTRGEVVSKALRERLV